MKPDTENAVVKFEKLAGIAVGCVLPRLRPRKPKPPLMTLGGCAAWIASALVMFWLIALLVSKLSYVFFAAFF